MKTNRFSMHVSLKTNNIARSIEFYRAFLGLEPVKRRADYAKYELADPGLVLTLNLSSDVARGGTLSHLGLRVETAALLRQEQERIRQAGIPIRLEEEGVNCCYALQDKFWVSDPDGNQWEVYHFLGDAERPEIASNAKAAVSACSETGTSCC